MSNDENVHQLFIPDAVVIRAHLEKLFGRVRSEYPGGRCEIAWTDNGPTRGITSGATFETTPDGLDKATALAVEKNREQRNVYTGVNPRKPNTAPWGRCDGGDVEIAFYQFVDCDTAEAADRLRRAPLNYTWAVTTGRTPTPRPHAYWELDEPIRNLEAWSRQQRALDRYFGSDNVSNRDRVMRLAGSVSYPSAKKIERGYQTEKVTIRVLYDDGERDSVSSRALYHSYPWSVDGHDPGEADGAGPTRPGEAAGAGSEADGGTRPDFGAGRVDPEVFIRNINAGHELHNNARDLIAHLVEHGYATWVIRELLTRLLLPVSDGGTLGQIETMIASARRKWGTPEPPEEGVRGRSGPRSYPLEWYIEIQPSLGTLDFVEGLLCEAGMSVIYGESNCGKTFFMTDLAFHIAAGRRWREAEVEQGGVIYVALEGGFGIRNRIAAIRKHYQVFEPIPLGILPCMLNLLDANADTQPLIDLILAAAKEIGMPVRLIIIDTLSRAMNGGNENAPEDMGSLVRSCDKIREQTGAHVAFVHHSGKDAARGARGHSLLRAATDTEVEVSREEGSAVSVAKVTKQRELEIEGEFGFTLKQVALGLNRRGKEVQSCVVMNDNAPAAKAKGPKLTDFEWSFWKDIKEMFARDGMTEFMSPEPQMPVLRVAKRATLRDWLIQRGKLDVTEARDGVRNALSSAERQKLHRVLNVLVNKGYLGMNQDHVWLLGWE